MGSESGVPWKSAMIFGFLEVFFLFDKKIHYKAKTIQRPIFVKKYFLQIHMDSPQNSLFPPNSCNWESIRLSPNNQNLLLLTFAQVDPFGVPGVWLDALPTWLALEVDRILCYDNGPTIVAGGGGLSLPWSRRPKSGWARIIPRNRLLRQFLSVAVTRFRTHMPRRLHGNTLGLTFSKLTTISRLGPNPVGSIAGRARDEFVELDWPQTDPELINSYGR